MEAKKINLQSNQSLVIKFNKTRGTEYNFITIVITLYDGSERSESFFGGDKACLLGFIDDTIIPQAESAELIVDNIINEIGEYITL